jgi:hypothetical protein
MQLRQTLSEFVVADRGIGVLSSLKQNPEYADLSDAGAALQLAITDGVSRFPSETGHGQAAPADQYGPGDGGSEQRSQWWARAFLPARPPGRGDLAVG